MGKASYVYILIVIMTNLSTGQPLERVIVSPSNDKNLEVKIKLILKYFLI